MGASLGGAIAQCHNKRRHAACLRRQPFALYEDSSFFHRCCPACRMACRAPTALAASQFSFFFFYFLLLFPLPLAPLHTRPRCTHTDPRQQSHKRATRTRNFHFKCAIMIYIPNPLAAAAGQGAVRGGLCGAAGRRASSGHLASRRAAVQCRLQVVRSLTTCCFNAF